MVVDPAIGEDSMGCNWMLEQSYDLFGCLSYGDIFRKLGRV